MTGRSAAFNRRHSLRSVTIAVRTMSASPRRDAANVIGGMSRSPTLRNSQPALHNRHAIHHTATTTTKTLTHRYRSGTRNASTSRGGTGSMIRAFVKLVLVVVVLAAIAAFFLGYRLANNGVETPVSAIQTTPAVDTQKARETGA